MIALKLVYEAIRKKNVKNDELIVKANRKPFMIGKRTNLVIARKWR